VKMSKDKKNQVVICKDGNAFPMGPAFTMLENEDYLYLDHFLDVTKANLFFARGVILVEGWAEEIILPVIAKKLGKGLTAKEVSIVNVGSTAYLHFAKIFMRKNQMHMGCKVAIVTDLDVRPKDDGHFDNSEETSKLSDIMSTIDVTNYPEIKWNIAKQWTLEWCLWKSTLFKQSFKEAAASVHAYSFKEEGAIVDDDIFEQRLMDKLRGYKVNAEGKHESVGKFDKVKVAYAFINKIDEDARIDYAHISDDDCAKYLIDAIIHVCS